MTNTYHVVPFPYAQHAEKYTIKLKNKVQTINDEGLEDGKKEEKERGEMEERREAGKGGGSRELLLSPRGCVSFAPSLLQSFWLRLGPASEEL